MLADNRGFTLFENKPPPQSGPCLLLKKGGLFSGGCGSRNQAKSLEINREISRNQSRNHKKEDYMHVLHYGPIRWDI